MALVVAVGLSLPGPPLTPWGTARTYEWRSARGRWKEEWEGCGGEEQETQWDGENAGVCGCVCECVCARVCALCMCGCVCAYVCVRVWCVEVDVSDRVV